MASSKQPTKPEGTKTVTAIKPGFLGAYREVGDVFEVPAGLKATWFVDAKAVEKPAEDSAGDLV